MMAFVRYAITPELMFVCMYTLEVSRLITYLLTYLLMRRLVTLVFRRRTKILLLIYLLT